MTCFLGHRMDLHTEPYSFMILKSMCLLSEVGFLQRSVTDLKRLRHFLRNQNLTSIFPRFELMLFVLIGLCCFYIRCDLTDLSD